MIQMQLITLLDMYKDGEHFIEFSKKLGAWAAEVEVDISVRTQKDKIIFGVSRSGKCVRRVFAISEFDLANKEAILKELSEAYLELADKF